MHSRDVGMKCSKHVFSGLGLPTKYRMEQSSKAAQVGAIHVSIQLLLFISLTLTLSLTLWQVAALYQQHHRAPSLPFVREYQVCLQTRLTEDAKHSTLMNAKMSATVGGAAETRIHAHPFQSSRAIVESLPVSLRVA